MISHSEVDPHATLCSAKSLPVYVPPEASVCEKNVWLTALYPVLAPMRTRYVPAVTPLKTQYPLASEVQEISPLSSLPFLFRSSQMVNPASPPSPESFLPLLFLSLNTVPLSSAVVVSAKSLWIPFTPELRTDLYELPEGNVLR